MGAGCFRDSRTGWSYREAVPKPAPTIRDVACEAGVSTAAVSLALRGQGTLSDATRKRVRDAARKLGYRRNVYAASLRGGLASGDARGMPVAVLIQQDDNGGWYPVEESLAGLRDGCAHLGFALQEHRLAFGQPLAPLIRTLYHRGVQGLFLGHSVQADALPQEKWAQFCVVVIGRGAHPPVFHSVRSSPFDVVVRAMEILRERGYRRPAAALFRHVPIILDDIAREAAFSWTSEHFGFGQVAPFLGDHRDREGFLAWARQAKADVHLCFHTGCWHWMREAVGRLWEVPFCGLQLGDFAAPFGLAGFRAPDAEMGEAAAGLMDSLIRHHERGIPKNVRDTLLRRVFVDGPSLPVVSELGAVHRGPKRRAKR